MEFTAGTVKKEEMKLWEGRKFGRNLWLGALKVKRMGSSSVKEAGKMGEAIHIFINQAGIEGEAGN